MKYNKNKIPKIFIEFRRPRSTFFLWLLFFGKFIFTTCTCPKSFFPRFLKMLSPWVSVKGFIWGVYEGDPLRNEVFVISLGALARLKSEKRLKKKKKEKKDFHLESLGLRRPREKWKKLGLERDPPQRIAYSFNYLFVDSEGFFLCLGSTNDSSVALELGSICSRLRGRWLRGCCVAITLTHLPTHTHTY